MGTPVNIVETGGIAVTLVESGGSPFSVAPSGFGIAVTIVAAGGFPIVLEGGIILSGSHAVLESASLGTVIGTASAPGTTGTPTWSLAADPSNKFTIDSSTGVIITDGALDYETATSHSLTIAVSGVTPAVPNQQVTITVTDVSVTLANTVAPAVTGTEEVGQTLSCSTGTWTNSPSSYTYQWFRAITSGGSIVTSGGLFTGNAIGSATASTYLLDAADEDELIYCEVTAHKAEATNVMAQSNATGAITAPSITYATWNPSDIDTNLSLSGGNLILSQTTDDTRTVRATIGKSSGKWYWEITTTTHISQGEFFGAADLTTALAGGHLVGAFAKSASFQAGGTVRVNGVGPTSDYGGSSTDAANGTVWGIALDMDNGRLYIHRAGTYLNSGDPAAGTGFIVHGLSGTYYPAFALNWNGMVSTVNFGATAFSHSVPTGYSSGVFS